MLPHAPCFETLVCFRERKWLQGVCCYHNNNKEILRIRNESRKNKLATSCNIYYKYMIFLISLLAEVEKADFEASRVQFFK